MEIKLPGFILRLYTELADLQEKQRKLLNFVVSHEYDSLSEIERQILDKRVVIIQDYINNIGESLFVFSKERHHA